MSSGGQQLLRLLLNGEAGGMDLSLHVLQWCDIKTIRTLKAVDKSMLVVARAVLRFGPWLANPDNFDALHLDMWGGGASVSSVAGSHAALQNVLSVSASHGIIASAGSDANVRVWQQCSNAVPIVLPHRRAVRCVALSGTDPHSPGSAETNTRMPRGFVVMSGSEDGFIRMWHIGRDESSSRDQPAPIATSAELIYMSGKNGHIGCVSAACWMRTHDESQRADRWVVSAGYDRTLRLWDTCSRMDHPAARIIGHAKRIYCLASAGATLFSGGADGTVKAWSVRDGFRCVFEHACDDAVNAVAAADVEATGGADGGCFFSGNARGGIRLWDVREHTCVASFNDEAKASSSVAGLAVCGGLLFSCGGNDRVVRVWDVRMRRVVSRLRGHMGRVLSIAAESRASIVSGDGAGQVRRWNLSPQPLAAGANR